MPVIFKRNLFLAQKHILDLICKGSVREVYRTSVKWNHTLAKNGPDQVLPADSNISWLPDGVVKLDVGKSGMSAIKPTSIHYELKTIATEFPDRDALVVKRNGQWRKWTYTDYYKDSLKAAKAFIKLGLDRHHAVCIMGAASPEWIIGYLGCIFAGGITAGIYTTNSPEACRHIADHSRAQIAVLQDTETIEKFMKVKHQLPNLKVFVQWLGQPTIPGVITWDEFISIGETEDDSKVQERLSLSAINHCCSLIYTSGTTGHPKGVMCSQDNLIFNGKLPLGIYAKGYYHSILYLPLNHIASIQSVFMALLSATTLYCAPPDAMKGSLLPFMKEVKPTAFLGVPRIWEKFTEGIKDALSKLSPTKLMVVNWARRQGLAYWEAKVEGRKLNPIQLMNYQIAEKLILSKVREQFGMSRVQHVITGTAPTDKNMAKYLMSFGLVLMDSFGMSECGVASMAHTDGRRFRLGSAGKIQEGVSVKVLDRGLDREDEGEVCIKGRGVFMGYLHQKEMTEQTIDKDGWLYTGDIGKVDKDDFLYITGRIKELVITAGGENIPPVLIEQRIKKLLPFISNAMIVGDKRKYIVILLTLKSEINLNTLEPLQELSQLCQMELKRLGSSSTTVKEVIQEISTNQNGPVAKAIQDAINEYNENYSISNAQKIQKWTILPDDFSLPGGELNATLKIKRDFVHKKYHQLIDSLFHE